MMYLENKEFVKHFRQTIHQHEIASNPNQPHRFISVCVVCMNRLEDLKQTLPQNLIDSSSYVEAEFVLLDYNSTDGLGEWVGDYLTEYILSGRLVYYRTNDPQYYVPCHSKNAVGLLGSGEIIVNVDADNYIHQGYLEELNDCFTYDSHVVAVSSDFLRVTDRLLLKGRVAFYKKDFIELGGYDEDLDQGWGSDDVHLVLRAILAKFKVARFDKRYVEDRIVTPDEKRVHNMVSLNIEELGRRNYDLVAAKLARRQIIVNQAHTWGEVTTDKNNLIMLRPSRQYLKNVLLPRLQSFQPILDIGIRKYNKHHKEFFNDYASVDIDPIRMATFIEDVTDPQFKHHVCGTYDTYGSVLFNGVIGYGVNSKSQLEASIINFHAILRLHGLLVIGWNENLMSRQVLLDLLAHSFRPILTEGDIVYDPSDQECHKFTVWEKVS